MLLALLCLALAASAASDPDDAEPRIPIGESAAAEDEDAVPTGLPPEHRRRGATVDEDPETQETG
jgi:hypothetical protein